MELNANIYYPEKKNRFPICRLTWIWAVLLTASFSIVFYKKTNAEISNNPLMETTFLIFIGLMVPTLFLMNYCRYRARHKKPLEGHLLNELTFKPDYIQIRNESLPLKELSNLKLVLNGYRNFEIHGVKNSISFDTTTSKVQESFELQSKLEYKAILQIMNEWNQNGIEFNFEDNVGQVKT